VSGLLVIGAGPAGLSAARAYRDAGGAGPVTLLGAEGHLPYERPPLTKGFLRGESERDELALEPAGWYAEQDVQLRHGTAAELHARERLVVTADGLELRFDACVLATGSEPRRPPIPGADDPEVLVMRTVEDSERLATAAAPGRHVVVVGSGFIGCEAAASCARRGARVTLVSDEDAPQQRRLGAEVGEHLRRWLEEEDVTLRLGSGVTAIERTGAGGLRVQVQRGEALRADSVLLGAGVEPRTDLARAAGLASSDDGRVLCDERLATSAEGVWAAGDIALAHNPAAGRRLKVEHWGEALRHGEVAGTVAAGGQARWDAVPGFWSTIGTRTLKYAAWGDGHDTVRVDTTGTGFASWYGREGHIVGVLTHEHDDAYERGRELVAAGEPVP